MRLCLAALRCRAAGCLLLAGVMLANGGPGETPRAAASELRRTPLVEAVERARPSIVNIHGEKLIDDPVTGPAGDHHRKVNGMGTGVVIDDRGYIVTNHHVIDGVRRIMVTTADRQTYVATVVAHDPKTDLAVIRIESETPLPVITMGTSTDLMPGETVIAVGNAFGYEHTVTQGIISALHRTVQVSETQNYEDLIQTDASINPGNSGGPLLNIDGQMIGINVAVRAGAQGIGFAIPVDRALEVAAELLGTARPSPSWHGLSLQTLVSPEKARVLVKGVEPQSPAEETGLQPGDEITAIDGQDVVRALDVQRVLLGRKPGEEVSLSLVRNEAPLTLPLTLADARPATVDGQARVWETLGLRLDPVPAAQFQQLRSRYRGGLTVVDVRPEGPAHRQGIRRGDVLVGMHVWETVSMENVTYILDRPDFTQLDPLKFYILRGTETLYGHLSVARRAR